MPPDGNTGALNSERERCPPAPRHRRLKDLFGGQRCTNAESALLDVGELNSSIDLGRQTAHPQITDHRMRQMVKIISGDVGAEGFHVGVYHRHRSRSGGRAPFFSFLRGSWEGRRRSRAPVPTEAPPDGNGVVPHPEGECRSPHPLHTPSGVAYTERSCSLTLLEAVVDFSTACCLVPIWTCRWKSGALRPLTCFHGGFTPSVPHTAAP